ncbi:uncharacterized protein LOC135470891 [Liolophura sinensis]|uniref:uncharacterized protein LOC135470891 n=1 Tax=Liolophura sinensis TaxID=3198878 RepID=UPI0031596E63
MSSTANSNPPPRTRPLKTALHQAVLDGRLHQVRLLVAKHNSSVDSRDVNGRTPLMLACILDSEDYGCKMAKIFIQAGTYLNIRDNMGRTALSYACMNGREGIVKMILREDVLDLNDADNDGYSPLHHATVSGNPRVVEMLTDVIVKFGLNVDVRNCLGYTALLLACKLGHYASAYILYTKGHASAALRDNEFFLTSPEWARRGQDINLNLGVVQKKVSAEPVFFSISREKTMYHRAFTPVCRHTRAKPDPLTSSCGSFLQYPLVFKSHPTDQVRCAESQIGGKNARQLLLQTMEELPVKRPFSTRKQFNRINPPSSAKLREITHISSAGSSSGLKGIFKIYSDQYGYNMQLRALLKEHFESTKSRDDTLSEDDPSLTDAKFELPAIVVNT